MYWGLTTHQALWVILCHLPEKGRKEIQETVEQIKERDGFQLIQQKQIYDRQTDGWTDNQGKNNVYFLEKVGGGGGGDIISKLYSRYCMEMERIDAEGHNIIPYNYEVMWYKEVK